MLKLAGYANLLISLFHFASLFFLSEALALTGVTDRMAETAAVHPALPAIVTAFVAVVFAVFGLYALVAAGVVKIRLPFVKPVIYMISAVYLLRGISGLIFRYTDEIPGSMQILFALAALGIGLLYLLGGSYAFRK